MSDIQLLFVCDSSGEQSKFERSAGLELLQEACFECGLRGFFLPHDHGFTGLFEGRDKQVLRQMERLVRSPILSNIRVVKEITPKKSVCRHWYVGAKIPNGIDAKAFLSTEYLAEFVDSKLKPLEKTRRQ